MTGCRGDGRAVIRVMVVDDHPMWRDGVARDLGERARSQPIGKRMWRFTFESGGCK